MECALPVCRRAEHALWPSVSSIAMPTSDDVTGREVLELALLGEDAAALPFPESLPRSRPTNWRPSRKGIVVRALR